MNKDYSIITKDSKKIIQDLLGIGYKSDKHLEIDYYLPFDGKEEIAHSERNCFDEFGNYVFPTDLVANTPNTVVGTSSGLSFINGIWHFKSEY